MPNALAEASSPYLLQHRDNPVDWRQWDEATLAEARATLPAQMRRAAVLFDRDGTLNPQDPPLLNEPCENARELLDAALRDHDVEGAWHLLNRSGWWEIDELKLAFDALQSAFVSAQGDAGSENASPNLTALERIHESWLASIDAYLAM